MKTSTAQAVGTLGIWLAVAAIGWHDPWCGVIASVCGIFATAMIWQSTDRGVR